ncbi:MAG TPA: zinc-ribbon domain-containing protein, partial [Polyangia bacterium]|nr:zinc-ribbon domain-containing protein [Polyangia bacterium]
MKIVCDSCSTKYSISDDKVRGKVFKIRCKKCSHIIVVKGTGEGA